MKKTASCQESNAYEFTTSVTATQVCLLKSVLLRNFGISSNSTILVRPIKKEPRKPRVYLAFGIYCCHRTIKTFPKGQIFFLSLLLSPSFFSHFSPLISSSEEEKKEEDFSSLKGREKRRKRNLFSFSFSFWKRRKKGKRAEIFLLPKGERKREKEVLLLFFFLLKKKRERKRKEREKTSSPTPFLLLFFWKEREEIEEKVKNRAISSTSRKDREEKKKWDKGFPFHFFFLLKKKEWKWEGKRILSFGSFSTGVEKEGKTGTQTWFCEREYFANIRSFCVLYISLNFILLWVKQGRNGIEKGPCFWLKTRSELDYILLCFFCRDRKRIFVPNGNFGLPLNSGVIGQ